ncbi:MAG: hypothetical protein A3B31_00520 [Candidatus Komeilibacteria bacterium RIFCSPLOWO2_01_FULL_53_11]|uniref:Uncharacterized protein n=1 Tax=Candidatus Komeilibacteria bacterium RIFCSPLOWO2_01_FULL_53_11 TaxID=1798552 RepID=A0A1G2BV66_9BACT|nr:MAG: hypothetical protein A3B31_00520 [Candidatus Komeilibacteria bacterium RIFCSPLOWO2_01_FULL_53_11]
MFGLLIVVLVVISVVLLFIALFSRSIKKDDVAHEKARCDREELIMKGPGGKSFQVVIRRGMARRLDLKRCSWSLS